MYFFRIHTFPALNNKPESWVDQERAKTPLVWPPERILSGALEKKKKKKKIKFNKKMEK